MVRFACIVMGLAACSGDPVHHLGDAPTTIDGNGVVNGTKRPGVYITAGSSIVIFDLAASGASQPVSTIAGPTTQLALPIGIAVDHAGNIYTANRMGSAVTVYDQSAEGDVAPLRTLTATGMGSPEGLALGADEDLWASTCPGCGSSAGGDVGVYHFAVGATTSDRAITGASLTDPSSLAIDAAGNVVVGNSFGGPVETFASASTTDATPTASFTAGGNLQSIAVGAASIAVAQPGSVDFYAPTASGTAAPASSIAASAMLPLSFSGGVFVDRTTTPPTIYLADQGKGNTYYVITTAGTEPNLTAASVVTVTSTALTGALDIAVVH